MGRLYDNWERLVEATLRREELREVARNPSVSSISSEFSSPIHDHTPVKSPEGPLEEGGSPRQNGQTAHAWPAAPVSKKRLSHLISMINGDHLEEFSLQKLLKATNGFSEENKIVTRNCGSVYYGTMDDGREVTIKRAKPSSSSSCAGIVKHCQQYKDNTYLNEIGILSRLNHKNLVRLLGYCEDCEELILVYEFMNNGTLHDHLYNPKISPLMSWPTRIKIALDAARGIEYLNEYAVPPVIHRDIKSPSILLDTTWTAKVSDFGLSLMGRQDDESLDVYSFGIVLLELLSGPKAIHKNEKGVPTNLVDYLVPYISQDEIHRVLDGRVPPPTPFEIEAVAYVGYLAADCVMPERQDRPPMTEVVNRLDRALRACLEPPVFTRFNTDFSATPRHNHINDKPYNILYSCGCS